MRKVSVIYWSGTGNTRAMAMAVAEGITAAGGTADVKEVGKAALEDVLNADAVALGCPSMGAESLEEDEMEPFVAALETKDLTGKSMALFGSYDWGDGQWMRDWTERMKKTGAYLGEEGLIVQNEPDEEGLGLCRKMGEQLAAL